MSQKLMDMAALIRSKNAGPFVMTFDIMFAEPAKYRHVKASGVLKRELFAKLYNTPLEQVHFVSSDAAMAFKISIPRPIPSGDVGCSDMHAGQQYAPLLDIEIPDQASRRKLLKGPGLFSLSDRRRQDPDRLVPIVCKPEDFIITVSGDPLRNNAFVLISNGKLGYTTSKKIQAPPGWDAMLLDQRVAVRPRQAICSNLCRRSDSLVRAATRLLKTYFEAYQLIWN